MTLQHISAVLLTAWMALPTDHPGIDIDDFELEDELTKPWVTIYNFSSKLRKVGWKGIKWLVLMRYLLEFAAAVCVLLLGASINIIALPKLRWKPYTGSGVYPETPLLRIQNISWARFESGAQAMFADGDEGTIRDATNSLIVASIFPALGVLSPRFENINSTWSNAYTFERHLPHWWGSSPDETEGLVPWLQAPHGTGITGFALNGSTLQTVSFQGGLILDMWVGFQNSDFQLARDSVGIDALLNVTLPLLSTSCQELPNAFSETKTTVVVISSQNSTQADNQTAGMSLVFPPAGEFDGVLCNVSLHQVLFSVAVINDTTENYDLVSINQVHGVQSYLPITVDDIQIMANLAAQFEDSLPALDALSPGNYTQMARSIGSARNLTGGLTAVVGTTLQHLITVAEWSTVATGQTYTTGPVQYRIYGAGPRLTWEWVIGKLST
jgi:hypothetical protein